MISGPIITANWKADSGNKRTVLFVGGFLDSFGVGIGIGIGIDGFYPVFNRFFQSRVT